MIEPKVDGESPYWCWRRPMKLVAVVGVLASLYLPFSWIALIDYPWDSYRLHWLSLWPILPGLIPTGIALHPADVILYSGAAIQAGLLATGLCWLAFRSNRQLILATIIGLTACGLQSVVAYTLFHM